MSNWQLNPILSHSEVSFHNYFIILSLSLHFISMKNLQGLQTHVFLFQYILKKLEPSDLQTKITQRYGINYNQYNGRKMGKSGGISHIISLLWGLGKHVQQIYSQYLEIQSNYNQRMSFQRLIYFSLFCCRFILFLSSLILIELFIYCKLLYFSLFLFPLIAVSEHNFTL